MLGVESGKKKRYDEKRAGVVELVDTPDLGSGGASCGGSSPSTRTSVCGAFCAGHAFFTEAVIVEERGNDNVKLGVVDMQIQELVNEKLKRAYKISVPFSTVDKKITTFIQLKGKDYKIPGFRPGKVPFSQLQKVFFTDALPHAIEEAVNEASDAFFKEKAFRAASKPKYSLESSPVGGKDLEFQILFEVFPELPEIEWPELALTFYEVEIPEDAMEEHLKTLASSELNSKPLETPRSAQRGDTLFVDMALRDKPNGEPTLLQNTSFYISEKGELGELEALVLGATPGTVVSDKINFPKDFPDPGLAGRSIHVQISVNEVRETIPFEVGEALAKHLKLESLEALKTRELEQLQQYGEMVSKLCLKRQVLDYLSERYTIDLPEEMVAMEFDSIWRNTLREIDLEPLPEQLKHRHFHDEDGVHDHHDHDHDHDDHDHDHSLCVANENNLSAEALAERDKIFEEQFQKKEAELYELYQRVAERRVRLGLLFGKIAETHEIKLTEEELFEVMQAEISRYPGREHEVFQFFRKNPQAFLPLQMPAFEQKIVDFISAQVPRKDEKIVLKKLEEILEEGIFLQ
jgi:trigger factor